MGHDPSFVVPLPREIHHYTLEANQQENMRLNDGRHLPGQVGDTVRRPLACFENSLLLPMNQANASTRVCPWETNDQGSKHVFRLLRTIS